MLLLLIRFSKTVFDAEEGPADVDAAAVVAVVVPVALFPLLRQLISTENGN